jgi:hypothetical protein
MLRFLERHHADPRNLLEPRHGLEYVYDRSGPDPFSGEYAADREILVDSIARLGASVPPILLSYLGATRDLVYLGAALDSDFGGAVECAILVPFRGLNQKARARFIDSYISINPDRFRELRNKEST